MVKSIVRLLADKSTYIVVVVGLIGIGITAVIGLVAGKASIGLLAFGIGPSAIILLVAMSARLDMIHDKMLQRDLSREILIQQIHVLEAVLRETTSTRRSHVSSIEFLDNAYEFYKALNIARAESDRSILLMKIHYKGPQAAGVIIGADLSEDELTDETLLQEKLWYDGLREWNTRGRTVERITVRNTTSMKQFIDDTLHQMRGSQYIAHIIEWDGGLPLLNLCIFDMTQVLITFSTGPTEDPYIPLKGVRIKDSRLATFLYHEYYKRLAACGTAEQPPK